MNRAEWFGVVALSFNIITLAFGTGVYVSTIEDHSERIQKIEDNYRDDHDRLIRIEDDVKYLREAEARRLNAQMRSGG